MKKQIMRAAVSVLVLSQAAYAQQKGQEGNGITTVVENCQSADANIKLTVEVVDNSYLEATLVDASSLSSTAVYKSEVAASDDGYEGGTMKIQISRVDQTKYATALVMPEDASEPRVFANLICEENVR